MQIISKKASFLVPPTRSLFNQSLTIQSAHPKMNSPQTLKQYNPWSAEGRMYAYLELKRLFPIYAKKKTIFRKKMS